MAESQRDVPELVGALSDADPKVRAEAAKALGATGDERAIQPLISALADDDWDVSVQASLALPQLGEAAVGPVIAALTDPSSGVPADAFRALGVDESDVAGLGDEDPELRRQAEGLFRGLVGFAANPGRGAGDATPMPRVTSVNEMFEQVVDPWKVANLHAALPDWSALADAVAPCPGEWRAVAWQDVGRAQWPFGGAYPRAPGDWVPIAQCYVEALRHNSAPSFLGWDVFVGGGPEDDPEAEALNERIRGRSDLSDAERAQLIDDLRRYVGAPGDPGPAGG